MFVMMTRTIELSVDIETVLRLSERDTECSERCADRFD